MISGAANGAAAQWGDVDAYDTLPRLLRHNANAHGDEIALREKDLGIWHARSWRHYAEQVEYLTLAFAELGFGQGDVAAMLGDNGCYWLYGAIAAHANRGLSLGVYSDVLAGEARDQIAFTGAKIAVVEDEEQADKLLSLGDGVPSLRHIIYEDSRGMRKYDDPRLASLDSLLKRGKELAEQNPGRFAEMTDAADADESALLISTSGTTARPKFAEISHRAFLRHIVRYLECDPKTSADEYVSALPLPWVMETKYVLGKSLVCRMKVNFAESRDTLMDDLREIGPTFLLLAPRAWEQIAGTVRARILDSTPFKRTMFNWGLKSALAAAGKGSVAPVADLLVFRALRDSLGFSRLSSASTGGAALGPDAYKFFVALGVPLKQIYGQTELLGAYTVHRAGDIDHETSGPPFEGVDVKIEDADSEGLGRILTRHGNMMRGYYKSPEETADAFKDGWMETGDAGYFKGKHLVVIDRFKDLARTSGGINFSPQHLENKLKFSPFIAEAVVFGDGKEFVTAMACIRYEVASKWAERRRIAFTNYADLSARPEMRELVKSEIAAANASLPSAQRVQRFLLLYKELDADDGELTRTKKVRRSVVGERYADIIAALYGGASDVRIDAEITLQDGNRQRIRTMLHIEDMDGDRP